MLGMTLLALSLLVTGETDLGRIVLQKGAVLSDPLALRVRHRRPTMTFVAKILLDMTGLADICPQVVGGLAVLRRPRLGVWKDDGLVALDLSAGRRRLVRGLRPFLLMATETRQVVSLVLKRSGYPSVLALPIRAVWYLELVATITECLDMAHPAEPAVLVGETLMVPLDKIHSVRIGTQLHIGRMAEAAESGNIRIFRRH